MVPSHLRRNLKAMSDVEGWEIIPGPLSIAGEKVTRKKRKELNHEQTSR
jgi:hypothetical protein